MSTADRLNFVKRVESEVWIGGHGPEGPPRCDAPPEVRIQLRVLANRARELAEQYPSLTSELLAIAELFEAAMTHWSWWYVLRAQEQTWEAFTAAGGTGSYLWAFQWEIMERMSIATGGRGCGYDEQEVAGR